jgi:enoyl-CoA hydratase/carnithine racemase
MSWLDDGLALRIEYEYSTVRVRSAVATPSVWVVSLARPDKYNAMNALCWVEWRSVFERIGADTSCRVVVIAGEGKHFCAGLDLMDPGLPAYEGDDIGRKGYHMRHHIKRMQDTFSVMEAIPQPVIAAVHGACIGAGIDMLCAASVRLCSADAVFSIKEVDVGLCADVGTLQRLPLIVGNHSLLNELALTARKWPAAEALQFGFVSGVSADRAALGARAMAMASLIATKSPLAVTGTKANLLYARDHTVAEGLDYVALWNASALQSDDMPSAAMAFMAKQTPTFAKL